MSKYKDTNEIITRIKELFCNDCNSYNGVKCRACLVDDCISVIEDAPTADL